QLVQLRQAQASAALNQALALQPNLAQAHLSLVRLYQALGYFDLTLDHMRAFLKLSREADPRRDPTGPGREAASADEEMADKLAEEVAKRLDEHTVAAAEMRVGDRAVLALEKGLAGRARDLLLESDLAAFGNQGMALELELLLRTGRTREVRQWTGPDQKAALGTAAYHWLRAQAL